MRNAFFYEFFFNISLMYFLTIIICCLFKSYVFFANVLTFDIKSILWFHFLCEKNLFVFFKSNVKMYLWNIFDIFFFNFFIVNDFFFDWRIYCNRLSILQQRSSSKNSRKKKCSFFQIDSTFQNVQITWRWFDCLVFWLIS